MHPKAWGRAAVVLGGSLLALLASGAHAITIDFDTLVHGEVVGTVGMVSVTASHATRDFDIAAAFDSGESATADSDLEFGGSWSGGNIAGTPLGRMLILQENETDCASGICSNPDDEGRRPAGRLTFAFSASVLRFGFDAVDIESVTAENATLTFSSTSGIGGTSGGGVSVIELMDFLDPLSAFYDPTIVLGNHSANRFAPISAAALGLSGIDEVAIDLGGSGALDNLEVTTVPEPSTLLLATLGIAGMALRARLRR